MFNLLSSLWSFLVKVHHNERGGSGVAVAADDTITHTKMNLKLETIVAADITAGATIASVPMKFQTFICPAPGTDWTPQLEGCGLAASKTTKKFWIPADGLKVGDIMTTFNVVGDAVEAAALTLDCKLVMVNKADPLTTTDITNGAMVQVTADGNFDVTVNCDDTTIATDKAYVWEFLATTGVGDSIIVTHIEATITRLLKPA